MYSIFKCYYLLYTNYVSIPFFLFFTVLLVELCGCLVSALPKDRHTKDVANEPLVGHSTNILTASLLKGSVDSPANQVFSPVGFASILAMISEGAEGQTRQELYDVLKFPADREQGKYFGSF